MEKKNSGVPMHTNPFCIIINHVLDYGALQSIAPEYFVSARMSASPPDVVSDGLMQEDAENLVRELYNADSVMSFAVQEPFAHIIPNDLQGRVYIAKKWNQDGHCFSKSCYLQPKDNPKAS